MICDKAPNRHYTCQIIGKEKIISDIESEFPDHCPNPSCGAKWKVGDRKMVFNGFITVGRGAYCTKCKACRFEVIDRPLP